MRLNRTVDGGSVTRRKCGLSISSVKCARYKNCLFVQSANMSKFFRKLIFCGCSSRTGLDGQSIVIEESLVDDYPPKFAEFSNRDVEVLEEPDVARHFDLSAIKFIDDDEEADEDACCAKNGSGRRDRSDFSFFIEMCANLFTHFFFECRHRFLSSFFHATHFYLIISLMASLILVLKQFLMVYLTLLW